MHDGVVGSGQTTHLFRTRAMTTELAQERRRSGREQAGPRRTRCVGSGEFYSVTARGVRVAWEGSAARKGRALGHGSEGAGWLRCWLVV
jgi:hypothetical protein